jgi:hypothetical protein
MTEGRINYIRKSWRTIFSHDYKMKARVLMRKQFLQISYPTSCSIKKAV